jgi:hypothetical protein
VNERTSPAGRRDLLARVTRGEWLLAAVLAVVLVVLVVIEPAVLEAPVENARTLTFTLGGTAIAATALVVMLRHRVHPVVRALVLAVPFVAVSWWLLSPFFIDEVVEDAFATSIAEADRSAATVDDAATGAVTEPSAAGSAPGATTTTTAPAPPPGPVLLGAGRFVGLAGHEGTGDAGFFRLDDGRTALRLENLDIDNGPDLQLYVVPGADQLAPGGSALHLGPLRGNVGNQTYDLPPTFALPPGGWTVLVWCEAFDVEFVAATVVVA